MRWEGKKQMPLTATIKTACRWVVPAPENEGYPEIGNGKVEWFRCLPFILVHLALVLVFIPGFSPFCILLFMGSYILRMFGITAFYHRYFSHRTFKTSRVFQFIGAALACTAGQRGPLWWAAHHRMHHRHSDTEKDFHSPNKKGFLWSHVFWFMTAYAYPTYMKQIPDWKRFPELLYLNRFDWVPFLSLGILLYLAGESSWATEHLGSSGLQWLAWGFILPTVALYHATFSVNSVAHLYGSRRYETKDASRNNLPVAVLTLGEGWHNNHHFFPGTAQQGFFKGEFDPTFHALKILEKLRVVHSVKTVPTWVKAKAGQ
jgi:stearoyl-CoA desaturase (delta-9 desaturase)